MQANYIKGAASRSYRDIHLVKKLQQKDEKPDRLGYRSPNRAGQTSPQKHPNVTTNDSTVLQLLQELKTKINEKEKAINSFPRWK